MLIPEGLVGKDFSHFFLFSNVCRIGHHRTEANKYDSLKTKKKVKLLFNPMLPDLRKSIAVWNVPGLARLSS